MIKETRQRIHFTPYRQVRGKKIDKNPAPTVAVSMKWGRITFGKTVIRETGMSGKFVRMYYEPHKKIIGWQIREQVEQHEMKTWKLCTPNKDTGIWYVAITKMLSEMKGLKTKHTYRDLEVQKYRDMDKLSEHANEVFYFVEVKEEKEFDLTLNGVKVSP